MLPFPLNPLCVFRPDESQPGSRNSANHGNVEDFEVDSDSELFEIIEVVPHLEKFWRVANPCLRNEVVIGGTSCGRNSSVEALVLFSRRCDPLKSCLLATAVVLGQRLLIRSLLGSGRISCLPRKDADLPHESANTYQHAACSER